MPLSYPLGIDEIHRQTAVDLYEAAFGKKFTVAIPNVKKRTALFFWHTGFIGVHWCRQYGKR